VRVGPERWYRPYVCAQQWGSREAGFEGCIAGWVCFRDGQVGAVQARGSSWVMVMERLSECVEAAWSEVRLLHCGGSTVP
jgi:hypothetical protein